MSSTNTLKDKTNKGITKRRVFVNIDPSPDYFYQNKEPKQQFFGNEVFTSKYNVASFVPKNLFEQFRYT